MKINPSSIKKSIPFILVILTGLSQVLLRKNPAIVEHLYAARIYPFIAYTLSQLSALVPFSLDDIFYVCSVLCLLFGLCLVIFRKLALKKYLLSIAKSAALIYTLFYFLWGFNYYREPAHLRLQLKQSTPNDTTFVSLFKQIIQQTNKNYCSTTAFKQEDYLSTIEASYLNMSDYLHLNHRLLPKSRVKHITFSNFFAKATILGYYGPFFSETHINKHLTPWDIPVVTAHERSHQLGVTSEAEASFYAWLICIKSDEPFVQYTGWLYALDYFLYQSRDSKKNKELIQQIRPEVIEDIKKQHKHWRYWRNAKIDQAASKVNDAYLKSNNVEKGIDDYNGVVQLIIDYMLT